MVMPVADPTERHRPGCDTITCTCSEFACAACGRIGVPILLTYECDLYEGCAGCGHHWLVDLANDPTYRVVTDIARENGFEPA